jgi:carbon-monoxide dehydrogenase medium subunit
MKPRQRRRWERGKVFRSALPHFEYVRPRSVKDAIRILARHKGEAALLAGGTDLVVRMKMDRQAPKTIVDIKRLKPLGGPVKPSGKSAIAIPPLTTLAEIATSTLLKRRLPVLPATALLMASPQVRNRATVGGNLANAAPSADMAPPLVALGARVKIHRRGGVRTIALEEFFTGPGETVLGRTGILGTITVPLLPRGARAAYHAHTVREAMDLSIASAAACVHRKGGKVVSARIVLGAVAPTPLRVPAAEQVLVGTRGTPEDVEAAAEAAAAASRPITDVRATEGYRRDIVKVVVQRALAEVLS